MRYVFQPPAARPLGLAGIMSTALSMYRSRPWALLLIAVITTLPVAALGMGSELAYGVPQGRWPTLARSLAIAVPTVLLAQIGVAAATVLAMDLLHRRPGSASTALELVGVRFWPLVAVVAVMLLGALGGAVALIIPALILMTIWLFAPPVAVVEGRGVRDALRRSMQLTRGAFWWTLGSYIVLQLTVAIVGVAATRLVSMPLSGLGGSAGTVANGVVAAVITSVLQPIALLTPALMYLDRRVRTEGAWPLPGPVLGTDSPV